MKRFFKTVGALFVLPIALSALWVYFVYMWRFAVSSFSVYWSFWLGIFITPFLALKILKSFAAQVYVIEHELTHAIFALISGARVKKISIKKDNGAVVVDKANTLITLAPYFFPLFAVSVFLVWLGIFYLVLKNPSSLPRYWQWILYFIVAGALSFHFFMTIRAVLQGQSDIKRDGIVYSLVVIFIVYVLLSAFFMKIMFGDATGFNTIGRFFNDIWDVSLKIYSAIWRFLKIEIWPQSKKIFA